jgi:predicted secreted Zn-dependent protease
MKTVLSSIALAAALCVASPAFSQGFVETFGVKLKEPGFLKNKVASTSSLQAQTKIQAIPIAAGSGMDLQQIIAIQPTEFEITNVTSTTDKTVTWTGTHKLLGRFDCRLTAQGSLSVTCVKSTLVASR